VESLKPEVSVLLPVKRWRSTTAEAVQSILDQSLKSLEVLLIGHDDVEAHFHQLPQDSRIRYIAREGHGIVAALNTGLARANGSFIARMDDDDVAYPERLETQIHFLNTEPKTNFCATQIRFIDESGGTKSVKAGNVRYAEWLNDLTTPAEIARACYTECPMPHPTWMAHKSE